MKRRDNMSLELEVTHELLVQVVILYSIKLVRSKGWIYRSSDLFVGLGLYKIILYKFYFKTNK